MKFVTSIATILFLLIGMITLTSCEKEDPEPEVCATWDADVKQIIDSTCAYAGCHSGGVTANPYLGEASNDFTTYAAIKGNLDNGTFIKRTLVDKNMPNPMFVPAGSPTELSQGQLDILQCWADAGFPEN